MEESFDKIVKIQLSDGSQLEFHMVPRLEAVLRSRYSLPDDVELPEDLLKEFLLASLRSVEISDDV